MKHFSPIKPLATFVLSYQTKLKFKSFMIKRGIGAQRTFAPGVIFAQKLTFAQY